MLDGVQYCFDETGHPRTGTYQEDGKVWELDSDGRVKNRLNGWKKTDGVLKYYDNSGAPAQGWTEIDGKDYFFVDGVSQAGWVETDAGTRYLDGNGNQMTGWCVIDGQPYAFGTNGEPKQGWDHSHEKSYYFINGVSQSGTFGEGALSSNLNGSGSVQPVGDQAPRANRRRKNCWKRSRHRPKQRKRGRLPRRHNSRRSRRRDRRQSRRPH